MYNLVQIYGISCYMIVITLLISLDCGDDPGFYLLLGSVCFS